MVATKQGTLQGMIATTYLVSEQLGIFYLWTFHCADFCEPQYTFVHPTASVADSMWY